ncbi:MAG: hypothetical protein Q7R76_03555 [Candidatus Woesearchaeota archaeon]|nr:hypothetical protein [Candidatus Woesearchaeota archaeon]
MAESAQLSSGGIELLLDPTLVATVAPAIVDGRNDMEFIARDIGETLSAFNAAVSAVRGEYTAVVHQIREDAIWKQWGDSWVQSSIVGFGTSRAVLYLGRIDRLNLQRTDDEYKAHIGVQFEDDRAIVHDDTLELRSCSLSLSAREFWAGNNWRNELIIDPTNRFYLNCSRVFIAPGYDATEKLLRRIGFQGDWTQDLRSLYASMQKQIPAIEQAAQGFFF